MHYNNPTVNDSKPRVLHLLYNSLPNLSGYSIRSHFILKHQKQYIEPYGLTNSKFIRNKKIDIIDKVIYFRFPPDLGYLLLFKPKIFKYARISNIYEWFYNSIFKIPLIFLRKIINSQKIDIIHGHTWEDFAKYGEKIAKEKNLPFIYEVRGFLEDTLVGLKRIKEGSRKYLKIKRKETQLMKKSDIIITLSAEMKKDLIIRGIDKNKIEIIPNAVNTEIFCPITQNLSLKEKLGIKKKFILGYIGSVRKIEGIEVLLKAFKIIKKEFNNIAVLIVGPYEIEYYKQLKFIINRLGIKNDIHFTGKVPNNKITDYYSIIDLFIIPRLNLRVNRLITPLKPLEIMAMGKPLIISDLPALRELVKPNISGIFFNPEDPKDLAYKIESIISDLDAMKILGERARDYVTKNFDWNVIIKKYISIYESLLR